MGVRETTTQTLDSLHLKRMFSGRVSGCQRCPSEPNNAADGNNAPSALLHHVREHLPGDGNCAKEVKIHQCFIHVNTRVYAQRALASTAVVDEDINL